MELSSTRHHQLLLAHFKSGLILGMGIVLTIKAASGIAAHSS